jgi:hypothetical protein
MNLRRLLVAFVPLTRGLVLPVSSADGARRISSVVLGGFQESSLRLR